VFVLDDCVHLVFEFVETDLEKLIKDRSLFLNEGVVKSLMHMVTSGVKACHDRFVLHRVRRQRSRQFVCGAVQGAKPLRLVDVLLQDLKPSNLLITSGGVVKLADFGLARYHGSPERRMSHIVATMWVFYVLRFMGLLPALVASHWPLVFVSPSFADGTVRWSCTSRRGTTAQPWTCGRWGCIFG
jgi:serine/threonine protein kinase